MTIPVSSCEVRWIDTDEMREVDRAMIEDFGIALSQMMENAGRALAHVARERFLGGDAPGKRVVVLAGTGGNGGGAITCARRLACWGAEVVVVVTDRMRMTDVPDAQLKIIRRMNLPVIGPDDLAVLGDVELIVDGIIGYALSGKPFGRPAQLISWANAQAAPILSLDVPSGLDTSTGQVFDPAIRATATVTLALPKVGLRSSAGIRHVGELYLADISVPPELYRAPALGLLVGPIFAEHDVVLLPAS